MKIEREHSFLDYVIGGCQIDLSIAIDFTLSNGNPRDPSSLHYFDPQRNQYLKAIRAVGDILQYFNSEKKINLYGFGATVAPFENRPSHCFSLTGDIFNPRVNSIEEVIARYRHALDCCKLQGPTYFNEVLKEVIDHAESS